MRVALLSADPTIEELVAELITYAGHEPARGGPATGGHSLLLAAAPIAMVDVCLPADLLRNCIAAAVSTRTTLVFFGSSVSLGDLRTFALQNGGRYFALPGGPTALKRVLETPRTPRGTTPPSAHYSPAAMAELSATMASNKKRAQMLVSMLDLARTQGRDLRSEHHELLEAVRVRRDALRNSVMDYARILRSSGLPCERATAVIADMLHSQEPAGEGVVGLIDAASRWVEQVYDAA